MTTPEVTEVDGAKHLLTVEEVTGDWALMSDIGRMISIGSDECLMDDGRTLRLIERGKE